MAKYLCINSAASTMEDLGSVQELNPSFRERCVAMAKEYRSRFYILHKCVVMLLCWHKFE